MPIAHSRSCYQEGTLERVKRAKGPDVWVFRWRESKPDGKRKQRKRVIGNVEELKTLTDAKRASDSLRLAVNAARGSTAAGAIEKPTVGTAWGHFQLHELSDPEVGRSPTTIDSYHDYFKSRILPKWRNVPLEDVNAVAIEQWLRSLTDLAKGSKAKIRNHLSALFAHAIRHRLYVPWAGINPIKGVRQGSEPVRNPDTLEIEEIRDILMGIKPQAVKIMVAVAGASALRRSEIRGVKWKDCDLDRCSFNLKQGVVRKHETNLKTKASRKSMPMMPELAEALREWRSVTPYNQQDDWVFASPFTGGKRPYWLESALSDHVRPAALAANIQKRIGWHTFRHSLATILGNKQEATKTVQDLLRHASSRITLDVYTHGDDGSKRLALTHAAGIFAVPAAHVPAA